MYKNPRRNLNLVKSNKEKIFKELIALSVTPAAPIESDEICGYISTMASNISELAVKSGETFLGYLLGLAAQEATERKNKIHRENSDASIIALA